MSETLETAESSPALAHATEEQPSGHAPMSNRDRGFMVGAIIIASAIVLAGLAITVTLAVELGKPAAHAKFSGPSIGYMRHETLTDFNKAEHRLGTEADCTYIPTKWSPGYTFTCYIYGRKGTGLGSVTVTATDSTSSGETTWNESYSTL